MEIINLIKSTKNRLLLSAGILIALLVVILVIPILLLILAVIIGFGGNVNFGTSLIEFAKSLLSLWLFFQHLFPESFAQTSTGAILVYVGTVLIIYFCIFLILSIISSFVKKIN